MRAYLDILGKIMSEGYDKSPVRMVDGKAVPVDGGVKTRMLPNQVFSHDMENGFPLLTTKRVPLRLVAIELEGFIKGKTDKEWYQERDCHIWDEWANPVLVDLYCDEHPEVTRKQAAEILKDLGPIYSWQWRSFGQMYTSEEDGVDNGADQLQMIVDTLNTNYNDRRMVCSAWNPNQIDEMGLPPCHWGWNVCVSGDKLNLAWVQRSCDMPYGVPFNIASYGLLLCLLAHEAGLERGNLTGLLVDAHVYDRQYDGVAEQLTRTPGLLPEVELTHKGSIFDWTHEDIDLQDYNPQKRITFGDVVV